MLRISLILCVPDQENCARHIGGTLAELAVEMLCETASWGVKPKYVLYDSWYAARAIFNLLAEVGWHYIFRIRGNRLLSGERLNQKWQQRYGQACDHLKQVRQEVRVIKDGKRYWVTNDLDLKPVQIKRQYKVQQ